MEKYILIAIGIFCIILTLMIIFRKGFAEKYVATSPKAYLWRKLFGEKRAVKIIKFILAPIGFLFGVASLIFGIMLVVK
jgi:hypothetical protein